MAKVTGRTPAAVFKALANAALPTNRTVKQQLHYLTAVRTGATELRIATLLGVKPARLRSWQSGAVTPTRANRAKIDEVFADFWRINNRGRDRVATQAELQGVLRLTGTPRGVIFLLIGAKRDERDSILLEPDRESRDWARLRRTTSALLNYGDAVLLIEILDIPINYLHLTSPGGYTLETIS